MVLNNILKHNHFPDHAERIELNIYHFSYDPFREPGRKRPRGRPRLRWEDGVKDDAAKVGCRNWTVVALNREGWRKLLWEAEAHPGM
jgi:hypothetical protein